MWMGHPYQKEVGKVSSDFCPLDVNHARDVYPSSSRVVHIYVRIFTRDPHAWGVWILEVLLTLSPVGTSK
jgi:hypothetical protein